MKKGFAEVNGTKLYYEISGGGNPVVFIHGFSLDSAMWDDQFGYFAGHISNMEKPETFNKLVKDFLNSAF